MDLRHWSSRLPDIALSLCCRQRRGNFGDYHWFQGFFSFFNLYAEKVGWPKGRRSPRRAPSFAAREEIGTHVSADWRQIQGFPDGPMPTAPSLRAPEITTPDRLLALVLGQ
jgi:hypothetical protein